MVVAADDPLVRKRRALICAITSHRLMSQLNATFRCTCVAPGRACRYRQRAINPAGAARDGAAASSGCASPTRAQRGDFVSVAASFRSALHAGNRRLPGRERIAGALRQVLGTATLHAVLLRIGPLKRHRRNTRQPSDPSKEASLMAPRRQRSRLRSPERTAAPGDDDGAATETLAASSSQSRAGRGSGHERSVTSPSMEYAL